MFIGGKSLLAAIFPAILTGLKSRFELAKSQFQLALLQEAQSKFDEARATLNQVIETYTRLGAEEERQRAIAELNRLTKIEKGIGIYE